MSLILKSNSYYTGTKKLPSTITQIMTADEYFASYKARVEDDGGIIVNETKTKATIDFLFANDFMSRANSITDSLYGIKKDGDKVTKLYAIDGSDLTGKTYGTGTYHTLDTDDSLKPTLSTGSQNHGCIYMSDNPLRVSAKGDVAMLNTLRVTNDDAVGYLTVSAIATPSDTNPAARIQIGADKPLWTTPIPNNVITKFATNAMAAGNKVITGYYSFSNNISKAYVDGVEVLNTAIGVDPAIKEREAHVQMGGGDFNQAKSFLNYNFFGGWALFDFTESELLQISAHIKALHS